MFFDPGDVLIHPILQELAAALADVARIVKQSVLGLDKRFRLAQCRHVQISQDITQVLLRQSGTDGPD